jgi:hypothetical protein
MPTHNANLRSDVLRHLLHFMLEIRTRRYSVDGDESPDWGRAHEMIFLFCDTGG